MLRKQDIYLYEPSLRPLLTTPWQGTGKTRKTDGKMAPARSQARTLAVVGVGEERGELLSAQKAVSNFHCHLLRNAFQTTPVSATQVASAFSNMRVFNESA